VNLRVYLRRVKLEKYKCLGFSERYTMRDLNLQSGVKMVVRVSETARATQCACAAATPVAADMSLLRLVTLK
jgi:hypothetical protein